MGDFGVYVHIPFCRRKCFYCDFPSYAGEERWMSRYREALCREIAAQGCRCLQEGAVRTVYIGGGTPTALLADDLLAVICAVRESFHLTGAEEFTVEVNPGTVDVQLLERLREAGVNRLSFGVQSFSDALLSAIGRIHTAREAEDAVRMAQKADFRVSLDLMYGLPGQTLADLKDSVARAAALGIGHISAYGLAVEDGTPFARMEEAGQLHLPTDDECGDMYDYITAELPRLATTSPTGRTCPTSASVQQRTRIGTDGAWRMSRISADTSRASKEACRLRGKKSLARAKTILKNSPSSRFARPTGWLKVAFAALSAVMCTRSTVK